MTNPQNLVFSIRGISGECEGTLENKGNVELKELEILKDSLLKTIEIGECVKAHIYASNLSFAFLTAQHDENNITLPKKIPVASIYVNYYKNKIEGKNFFIIFFYFYPAESNKPLPLMEYLNRPIKGTFGLELLVNDNSHLIGEKGKFIGYHQTLAMMEKLLKTDSIIKLIEDFTLKFKIENDNATPSEIFQQKQEAVNLYQKYMNSK